MSTYTDSCLVYSKGSFTVVIMALFRCFLLLFLHNHLSNSCYENILGKQLRTRPTLQSLPEAPYKLRDYKLNKEKHCSVTSCGSFKAVLFVDKAVLRGEKMSSPFHGQIQINVSDLAVVATQSGSSSAISIILFAFFSLIVLSCHLKYSAKLGKGMGKLTKPTSSMLSS